MLNQITMTRNLRGEKLELNHKMHLAYSPSHDLSRSLRLYLSTPLNLSSTRALSPPNNNIL